MLMIVEMPEPDANKYTPLPLLISNHSNFLPRIMSPDYAYVTLLTKTSYLAGVLVLHSCLRAVNSKYPLVVMVTPSLPEDARAVLRKRRICIREVKSLQPPEGKHTLAPHDARFADTWTKLRFAVFLYILKKKAETMTGDSTFLNIRYNPSTNVTDF
jgi:hypothetical protein